METDPEGETGMDRDRERGETVTMGKTEKQEGRMEVRREKEWEGK